MNLLKSISLGLIILFLLPFIFIFLLTSLFIKEDPKQYRLDF